MRHEHRNNRSVLCVDRSVLYDAAHSHVSLLFQYLSSRSWRGMLWENDHPSPLITQTHLIAEGT